jgi:mercuric ion binding protein
MRTMKVAFLSLATCLFGLVNLSQADTKVTLSGVHLCCGACVSIAKKAVSKLEGVSVTPNQDARTIVINAADDAGAAAALKALSEAGFYGKSDNDKLAITYKSPKGKVEKLEVAGAHNCCGACAKALKKVVTGVAGVTAIDIKPKTKSFSVTGNFEQSDVIQALNDAGFYATVASKE